MQLQLQNFTTLVQNMAAAVQGSATALVNLTTGSVLRAILEANASLALWIQWLIVQVLATTRAATSNDLDLDSWVEDFGMTRLPGQGAVTLVTFSRVTSGFQAVIPVGAQVKTGDATVTFAVLPDPTNPAYSAASATYTLTASSSALTVPVQAIVPGTSGNVQAGAISLLATAMPGIDLVTNPNPAVSGMDAESDNALRGRFANFIDSRSRATPAAIAYTIQSLQQGLTYFLAENTDPSGSLRPGYFTVTVNDGSGVPPPSLINAISAALEAVRPVGTQFAVQPPTVLIANISLTLSTPTVNHAAAQLNVATAIQTFLAGLPIGAALPLSRVAAIAYSADPAVTDVTDLSINGAGDLTPPVSGVIMAGTITVN